MLVTKRLMITLLLFTSFRLAAQIRYVQVTNSFIKPEENTFYKLPNVVYASFSATLYGGDSLFKGDTIKYTLRLKGVSGTDRKYIVNRTYIPGERIILYDTLDFTDPPPGNPSGSSDLYIIGFTINSPQNGQFGMVRTSLFENDSIRASVLLQWNASYNNLPLFSFLDSGFIYPNPGDEVIFLNIINKEIQKVIVFDLQGNTVYQTSQIAAKRIQLGNLPNSSYVIQIICDDGSVINEKWIKRR